MKWTKPNAYQTSTEREKKTMMTTRNIRWWTAGTEEMWTIKKQQEWKYLHFHMLSAVG